MCGLSGGGSLCSRAQPDQARAENEFVPQYEQFVPGCFETCVGHTRFGVWSDRVREGTPRAPPDHDMVHNEFVVLES